MSRHYLEGKSNRYTTYTDAITVFNAHTSVRPDYSMDSISWDGWLCVSVRFRETKCGEEARIRVKWWSIYGTKSRAPLLRFIIYANHLRTINQIKIISFALKGHPTNPHYNCMVFDLAPMFHISTEPAYKQFRYAILYASNCPESK